MRASNLSGRSFTLGAFFPLGLLALSLSARADDGECLVAQTFCSADDGASLLEDGTAAVATYDGNSRWTASISGATWIWDAYYESSPQSDHIESIYRTFEIHEDAYDIDISVEIGADNSYGIWLNGTAVGSDPTETNYFAPTDTWDATSAALEGENELEFEVWNWAQPGGNAFSNPGGLLYCVDVSYAYNTDTDGDGTADCNDEEECDGYDNDGDGEVDEGMDDTDGDGVCDAIDEEECDGADNDGDGDVDEGFDADSDGVADCYDEEDCDGADNDGDGEIDEDFDEDGDGFSTCGVEADCGVLFDLAHGEDTWSDPYEYTSYHSWGPAADMLLDEGYDWDANKTGSVTAELLEDYQMLVIAEPVSSFSAAEVTAILDYVYAGGGLLLITDFNETYMNPISTELGVQFYGYSGFIGWVGVDDWDTGHDVTDGIESVFWAYGSTLEATDAEVSVLGTYGGDSVFGAREYGAGRVVFSADNEIFATYGFDQVYDPDPSADRDNETLWLQTTDYLSDCEDDVPVDCDDADGEAFPGNEELCDGIDNDCDGDTDEDQADTDGDGTCDDLDEEDCDGVDNDGDGDIDEDCADTDGDGTPDVLDEEECDGSDNDGDGDVDEDCADTDGDGTPDTLDPEECDGVDNDGDGDADEGFDSDGDGTADCYDSEVCDGEDNDGDGNTDEDNICGDDDCLVAVPDECLTLWQAHARGWVVVESDGSVGEKVTITNIGGYDVCIDTQALYTSDGTQAFFPDAAITDASVTVGTGESAELYYASWTTANGTYSPYSGEYGWWCVESGQAAAPGATFDWFGELIPEALGGFADSGTDEDGDGVDDLVDWAGSYGVQANYNIWSYQSTHSVLTVGKVADASGEDAVVTLLVRNIGADDGTGTLSDTVPDGWTASGFSPEPDSQSTNGDGSTTLAWSVSVSGTGGGSTVSSEEISYSLERDSGYDVAYAELDAASVDYSDGFNDQTSWSSPAAIYNLDVDSDDAIECPEDETCDGVDNDLDGDVDEDLDDTDGDGTCDALDEEGCDGVDNDGDGDVDEDCADTDGDGTPDDLDEEECDGLDNDGDGEVDEGFDSDSDGTCDEDDTEVCDGADNDGDGDTDEAPGGGDLCGGDDCEDDVPDDCLTVWQAHARGWLVIESGGSSGEAVTFTNLGGYDVCIDTQALYSADGSQSFFADGGVVDGSLTVGAGESATLYYASWTTDNGTYSPYLDQDAWWCVESGQAAAAGATFDYLGEGVPAALAAFGESGWDEDGDGTDDRVDWASSYGVQANHNIWDWQADHAILTVGKLAEDVDGDVQVTLTVRNIGAADGDGTVTDTVPAGWTADGFSPEPDSQQSNGDGTTTLVWSLTIAGSTGGAAADAEVLTYTISRDSALDASYLELAEASVAFDNGEGADLSYSLPAAVYNLDVDGDGELVCYTDEVCDGVDNDGDGDIDEDATDASTWYLDADSDGYGDASSTSEACGAPSGYVDDATDCDDGDAALNPGATEECDAIDNDCDGQIDDDDDDLDLGMDWDTGDTGDTGMSAVTCADLLAAACHDGANGVYNYCTEDCPCQDGEGDCDSDLECAGDTTCVADGGATFGLPWYVDMCMADCAQGRSVGDHSYCTEDCPGGEGAGDCDSDAECADGLSCVPDVGASFGYAWYVDVCTSDCHVGDTVGSYRYCSEGCPCDDGEGDCDSDAECGDGLVCGDNNGSSYGFTWYTDVCVPE